MRRHLRKAERVGVEIEMDTTGRLVPVFHQIFREWVERWVPKSGLPPMVARRLALRQEPSKLPRCWATSDRNPRTRWLRILLGSHRGRTAAARAGRTEQVSGRGTPIFADPLDAPRRKARVHGTRIRLGGTKIT